MHASDVLRSRDYGLTICWPWIEADGKCPPLAEKARVEKIK